MRVAEMDDDEFPDDPRAHPWTESYIATSGRYYNFVKDRHLIRTVLEDFKPWERYRAIERFYEVLEFLNSPTSPLETSECMFLGVDPNTSPQIPRKVNARGRLMLLYRDLPLNTSALHFRRLYQTTIRQIEQVDAGFEWGGIMVGAYPTVYTDLPRRNQYGRQLVLKFWAWGDSEIEAMDSLDRVFQDLHLVLSNISAELAESR